MKTGKTRITLTAIAISLALGIGISQADSPITAPDQTITITGKKPVGFSHPSHLDLGIACAECHHDEKHLPRTDETIGAMGDSAALQCASCHNSGFAKPELQGRKEIFHLNCQTCHKAGFNGKNGPTKCNDCHLKKRPKAIEGC